LLQIGIQIRFILLIITVIEMWHKRSRTYFT